MVVSGAGGGIAGRAAGWPFGAGRVAIATASTEKKRRHCLVPGADAANPADDLGAALIEANDGNQVDVVLEMSGGRVFDACSGAPPRSGGSWPTGSPGASKTRSRRPADAKEPRGDRLRLGTAWDGAT